MDQFDDNLIIKNVTKVISSFLSKSLPDNDPETYLRPHLPPRVKHSISKPSDLKNSDLYCNLRVLIYNDRFFRDAGIFNDATINGCARLVLSYRNRLAHQNLNEIIAIEHLQLEYTAINRLISLLPTEEKEQPLIEETRIYIGSLLVYLAKEYFNTELASNKFVEVTIRSVSENDVKLEEYNDEDDQPPTIRISISECKQQLRALRELIQKEIPDLPKWSNVLRESLLDQIVVKRIKSWDDLKNNFPSREIRKTDDRQVQYFYRINEIISRM